MDSPKFFTSVSIFCAIFVVSSCVLVLPFIFFEASELQKETQLKAEHFKVSSESLWIEILRMLSKAPYNRGKRQGNYWSSPIYGGQGNPSLHLLWYTVNILFMY